MCRACFALIALPALVLAGCDSGRSRVIVGTIVAPKTVFTNTLAETFSPFWASRDDQEWSKEKECVESASAHNWKEEYSSYSQVLVARAAEVRLDSVSLSNVLKVILADGERQKMAYLPFAAYSTDIRGEPVWVVDLTWEYECFGHFGHIRTYAINATNLNQVGFRTCN